MNIAVPEVSVVMPVFNSARFLMQAIQSVVDQTFTSWELLAVDDCSTDSSWQLLTEWSNKDSRIIISKNDHNQGAAVSRNIAISKARGRYIAFLDSDDVWLPEKISEQLAFLKKNDTTLVFSAYQKMTEDGLLQGIVNVPLQVTYQQLLKTNYIGCLTAIYDTSKIGKIFMPEIRKRQDYALWLAILKKIPAAHGIQKVHARYRVRDASLSSSKVNAATYQWQVYRIHERLSLLSSVWYFCHYAFLGWKRSRI